MKSARCNALNSEKCPASVDRSRACLSCERSVGGGAASFSAPTVGGGAPLRLDIFVGRWVWKIGKSERFNGGGGDLEKGREKKVSACAEEQEVFIVVKVVVMCGVQVAA